MIILTPFPSIDLTVLAVALSVMTGSVLLVLLALSMNQPVLLRMALRNMFRRSHQTVVLLGGLILSTVVITASFGLWDSLLNSAGANLAIGKPLFVSTAGRQFFWLLPLLSCLLIGAGMLLLVLLLTLLVAERRAELGMSRALGLQRSHLTLLLLFESAGYGLVALVVGIPMGLLLTALELGLVSRVPAARISETGGPVQLSLAPRLDWQGMVICCCLSLLVTLLTIWLASFWINRLSIVTAIRDLDAPNTRRSPLSSLLHTLWHPPLDHAGQPIPETRAARLARRAGATSGLLWGCIVRGPFCLLAGGVLFALATAIGMHDLAQLAIVVLLAGLGLLVGWLLPLIPLLRMTPALAQRVGFSLIGLNWLIFSFQLGSTLLTLFQPGVVSYGTRPASVTELLLSLLLPLLGMVVLVLTNADALGALCTLLLRRLPGFAPLSRTSLVYPLTFRFRMSMTVTLLSLITFLVLLLVITDSGSLQETPLAMNNGGFQLAEFFQSNPGVSNAGVSHAGANPMTPPAQMQAIQSHRLLTQDFSAVGLLRPLFYPAAGTQLYKSVPPIYLDLANRSAYPDYYLPPLVADDGFLSTTTLPVAARAEGYTSDTQVWNAVRDHPGYGVLTFVANLGLPTSNGFVPFTAEVPDGITFSAHFHPVTIIGILPSGTLWQDLFISQRTAAQIIQPPFTGINTYLFRLQPGVSQDQASRDLRRTLVPAQGSMWDPETVEQFDAGIDQEVTPILLLVLSSYLALGLLFGIIAIGIIASRAVVERRQQIGMLRALGLSRALVRRSFFLETSFVLTLSLLVGPPLACWLAYQVALQVYGNIFPIPVWPVALLLLGTYLVVWLATLFPANQAARLHPAEALRYE